ncbi:DUF1349 domain-containing protein [Actinoplanes sp. TBRC 11911]|uniref:DUF1349 domain-containing protein n=1 Tax=Actinoplanes sp. TBRC 11911 TaxID=2729386 RepID=UPI00145F68AF|nr:DUF1349 domain-containing protein [Actinoplanes sp. TBRC 11911]NMO51854.1 DUF1349 domain-containing protein [Actinoplanes sp. TBRC 11911]
MLTEMKWLNEPQDWSVTDGVLRAVTGERTDFWRETFYGWVTDNGHFYHRAVEGDFTAEATVDAAHDTRFDQAGMMVRGDARNWLKAGLEVTSGQVQVSTVYTRDFSDLSVTPVAHSGWAAGQAGSSRGRATLPFRETGDRLVRPTPALWTHRPRCETGVHCREYVCHVTRLSLGGFFRPSVNLGELWLVCGRNSPRFTKIHHVTAVST